MTWHVGVVPWHMRDIRLQNNAGVSVPVCEAGRTYLRACGWAITTKLEEVTCKKCKAQFSRKYSWAMGVAR